MVGDDGPVVGPVGPVGPVDGPLGEERFHALEAAFLELQRVGASIRRIHMETEKVAGAHARGFLSAQYVGEVVHWSEVEHRFRAAMSAYEDTLHPGRHRLHEPADHSIAQPITVARSTGSASAASGGPVQS